MRTLEENGTFSYIAWATFIVLSVGTLFLANELKKSADYLGEKTLENVAAIDRA